MTPGVRWFVSLVWGITGSCPRVLNYHLPCQAWLLTIVIQNQAAREEDLKNKVEERNRKAELVRQNKMKIVHDGGDVGPESA